MKLVQSKRQARKTRAQEFKKNWVPTRDTPKACIKGHRFTEENTSWVMIRGRIGRRCRACRNEYHNSYQKETRWEREIFNKLVAAEKVILKVIKTPDKVDPLVIRLAARFGHEARCRWRVATKRSK